MEDKKRTFGKRWKRACLFYRKRQLVMFSQYMRNMEMIISLEEVTGLKSTRVSELLKLLLNAGMIQAAKGHGKGKYHFCGVKRLLR